MARTAVLDFLKVEIFTVPEDNFVLGLSLLGFETLGGSGLEPTWREIQCNANNVSMRRGGSTDGAATAIDAGYTTITLVNSENPVSDPGVLPNVPMRVSALVDGSWRVIFTGHIEDVSVRYNKDGDAFVTLSAADAVRDLKNIMRYGNFRSIVLTSGLDGFAENTFYSSVFHPSRGLLAGTDLDGTMAPTPPAGDLSVGTVEKYTPTSTAGWTRWGTPPPGVTEKPLTSTGWSVTVADNSVSAGTVVDLVAYSRGVQRTFTGLTVGETYQFKVATLADNPLGTGGDPANTALAVGVVIGGETLWGPTLTNYPYTPDESGNLRTWGTSLYVSFKATSTSHVLRVARAYSGKLTNKDSSFSPEYLAVSDITLYKTSNGGRLLPVKSVAYQSTLFEHLKMLCNTEEYDFWIRPDGSLKLQAREYVPVGWPTPLFSDSHEPGVDHVCYTDIVLDFDTRNLVNFVTLNNHGARPNPETAFPATGWRPLVDDTETPFYDATSMERYGPRKDTVDTRAPDWALTSVATRILSRTSNPQMIVKSITVNTLQHPGVLLLDLFDKIEVEFQNFNKSYSIVGISHSIEGSKWATTFSLRRELTW